MRGRKKPANEASGKNQRYSRRDFLIAGGTAVAVDALIPGSSAISAETKAVYPASKGYLGYTARNLQARHSQPQVRGMG